MQATTITDPLLRVTGMVLLCAALTACGQKGPLTLPQQAPQVAEPEQQNNINQQPTEDESGSV